jgi:hypothetical protein
LLYVTLDSTATMFLCVKRQLERDIGDN